MLDNNKKNRISTSILFKIDDHGNGSPNEDYDDSDEDDYDNDDDGDEHVGERKPFPFFTPVTPYPVYCTYFVI